MDTKTYLLDDLEETVTPPLGEECRSLASGEASAAPAQGTTAPVIIGRKVPSAVIPCGCAATIIG